MKYSKNTGWSLGSREDLDYVNHDKNTQNLLYKRMQKNIEEYQLSRDPQVYAQIFADFVSFKTPGTEVYDRAVDYFTLQPQNKQYKTFAEKNILQWNGKTRGAWYLHLCFHNYMRARRYKRVMNYVSSLDEPANVNDTRSLVDILPDKRYNYSTVTDYDLSVLSDIQKRCLILTALRVAGVRGSKKQRSVLTSAKKTTERVAEKHPEVKEIFLKAVELRDRIADYLPPHDTDDYLTAATEKILKAGVL